MRFALFNIIVLIILSTNGRQPTYIETKRRVEMYSPLVVPSGGKCLPLVGRQKGLYGKVIVKSEK